MSGADQNKQGLGIGKFPGPADRNVCPTDAERRPIADYFDQIFQAPAMVCGRQLKFMSIGRYRLMAWFKVAFVAEEERAATAGDLLMAVLICSMSVAEFTLFAGQPNFQEQVKAWGQQFGFFPPAWFSWPIIGKSLERFMGQPIAMADATYLGEQMAIFQKYIEEGSRVPDYWDESPDSRGSAAHWSQSIEVALRGKLGWTQEQVNEEPLGKALWDYFKLMENEGLVRLMTVEEARYQNTPLTPEESAQASEAARRVQEYLAAQRTEKEPEVEAKTEVVCG